MDISTERYNEAQVKELGYWAHTPHPATNPWWWYDRHFIGYMSRNMGRVADVGCGPVPYLLNHNVVFEEGYAVDPLIAKYMMLPKYESYWGLCGLNIASHESIKTIPEVDVVFFLNAIDHAQDPWKLLSKVVAKLKHGGRLFLFSDVGKPPDAMHPHTIDPKRLQDELKDACDVVYGVIEPSWKFANSVMYYVGNRR